MCRELGEDAVGALVVGGQAKRFRGQCKGKGCFRICRTPRRLKL